MSRSEPQTPESCADVSIVGRLGSRVGRKELPSGDSVAVFTVIVDRPPGSRPSGSRVSVDAIACQAFRAGVVRRLETLDPGTWVRVDGRLRRRFWRTGAGLGSAMEVEVSRLVRC
jgi:single-strand DNA-binding protein